MCISASTFLSGAQDRPVSRQGLVIQFCRWGVRGSEKFCELPKAPPLTSGWAETGAHTFKLWDLSSSFPGFLGLHSSLLKIVFIFLGVKERIVQRQIQIPSSGLCLWSCGQCWLEVVTLGYLWYPGGAQNLLHRSPKGAELPGSLSPKEYIDMSWSHLLAVLYSWLQTISSSVIVEPRCIVKTDLATGCRMGCLYWLHISTWLSPPSHNNWFLVLTLIKAFVVWYPGKKVTKSHGGHFPQ